MMNDMIRELHPSSFLRKLSVQLLKGRLKGYEDIHQYYDNLDRARRGLNTRQKKHWLSTLRAMESYNAVLKDLEETPSCLLH